MNETIETTETWIPVCGRGRRPFRVCNFHRSVSSFKSWCCCWKMRVMRVESKGTVVVAVRDEKRGKRTVLEVTMPEKTTQILEVEVIEPITGEYPAVILVPIDEIPYDKKLVVIETMSSQMNVLAAIQPSLLQGMLTKGVDLRRDISKALIEAEVKMIPDKEIRAK